jgi:hypothetical protein
VRFGSQDRRFPRLVPKLVPRDTEGLPAAAAANVPRARFPSGFRVVGAARFELATFRPPAERATKLRHAPYVPAARAGSGRRESNPH